MLQVIPNWVLCWNYEDGTVFHLIVAKRTNYEAVQMSLDIMHSNKTVKSFTCYKQEL